MNKPCTLGFNNSGSWKTLGHFDAANESHANHVMAVAVAEDLVKALNIDQPAKRYPTLRISRDDGIGEVLMRWDIEHGWHANPRATP